MTCKKKTYSYILNGSGFGSEINNLLYAIYYCQIKNHTFAVLSSDWNCSQKKGWHDYFDSLHFEHSAFFLISQNKKYLNFFEIFRFFLNKILQKNNYVNFNKILVIINKIRKIIFAVKISVFLDRGSYAFNKMREFCYFEREKNYNSFILSMHKILISIWKIKPQLLQGIQKNFLKEDRYVVIHIRRGDKVTSGEDVKYEVQEYINVLFKLNLKIRTIFLMSDDSNTYFELKKKLPNYKVLTLMNNDRVGFNNKVFNSLPLENKKKSTLDLLTEIEIAKRSTAFIGSFNSNIYRLIEYFKLKNCFSVSKDKSKL